MPATFPCPNPACTHSFSLTDVQGASQLRCPRCGAVFQFRQPSATPATPSGQRPAVPATPTNTVPMAVPVAPDAPDDLVFASSRPKTRAKTTPPIIRRRARPTASNAGPWLGLTVVVFAVVGLTVAFLYGSGWWHDAAPANQVYSDEGNLRFTPPAGFEDDRALRTGLKVPFAMKRSNPPAWFAFHYFDYKTREPSEGELFDGAIARLRDFFKGGLEWERRASETPGRLGGESAQCVDFEGRDADNQFYRGECLVLARRGWGYWFFTWGPADAHDALTDEWEAIRSGFHLGDARAQWSPPPRRVTVAHGAKVPYQLKYGERLWKSVEKDGYDPQAELVLRAFEGGSPQHAGKLATVQVIVADRAADLKAAAEATRARLLKKYQDENLPDTTLTVIKDKEGREFDGPRDLGGYRPHVTKLQVNNGDNRLRYAVLATVNDAAGALMVVCECPWERRDFWDEEFTALLETFDPRRQEPD